MCIPLERNPQRQTLKTKGKIVGHGSLTGKPIEGILGFVYLIQTLVLSMMRNIFLLWLHSMSEAAPSVKVYDFNTKCRLDLQ